MNNLPEIILKGNAYERGLQHGSVLRNTIQNFLADNKARINSIRQKPLPDSVIKEQVLAHTAIIESQLPGIAEEIRGLSDGAGISYEDAVLLQIRMELIAFNEKDILEGDCTTIGFYRSPEERITGQTIDLPGNMNELGVLFRVIPEDDNAPEILMYGFAGLLGYMGLNSKGLSININMVVSDNWQHGVSPYLLVRHLLNLSSVEECLEEINRITLASSRSLLVADNNRMINIECTPVEHCILENKVIAHTNHYLHPDLLIKDRMHFLFKNSSIKRLKVIKDLTTNTEIPNAENLFSAFSDHSLFPVGICAHAEGNIRRSETVGSVVMEPAKLLIHARKGYACSGKTETFGFSRVEMNT